MDNPARGLPGEPESVTEDDQATLTEQARQRALDERIRTRKATAGDIERELAHLEGRCRYLRRQLKRLQR